MSTFSLSSPVFAADGHIPPSYTCEGDDVNPPLVFSGTPPAAKSLALIMDDPDAPMGTWVHWLVWNIRPETAGIQEDSVPQGAVQGKNDWHRNDYGGPCPPSGTHRYFFKLYALDAFLDLPAGTAKKELERAMEGHIIARAVLVGLYKKRR